MNVFVKIARIVVSTAIVMPSLLSQCQVNVNMPPPLFYVFTSPLGTVLYPIAWGQSRAVKFVFCENTNCGGATAPLTFPAAAKTAMIAGFNAWTNVRFLTNSYVNFYQDTYRPANDEFFVDVKMTPVEQMDGAFADISPYWGYDPWRVMAATLRIAENNVTILPFMTHLILHELGHTFALNDCDNCTSGTTPMKPQHALGFAPVGISTCDQQQTRQTAYP